MRPPKFRAAAVVAAAMLAAAGLALAGQPASAAPPRVGGARADRPAPIDPHGATAHAQRRAEPAPAEHAVPNPLLREVLAGEDDEAEQDADLSALCQDFIGKPNPYANPAPNVDAISGDTIVSLGTQAGCSSAQNETTIAVNPFNPRNLVAGSNDYRVFNAREQRNDGSGWAYTTSDGGRTWANVLLPHLTFQTGAPAPLSYMDSAGDPAIAFGPHNTVYYANLVFSRVVPADGSQQASGLTVSVSHNGGLTWDEPTIIQLDGVNPAGTPTPTNIFNDKEWIAADPVSGAVYVSWTRFTFDAAGNYLESPIVVSRSSDFGKHFSTFRRVAPSLSNFKGGITPFDQGSNPVVGRNGALFIAYEASVCETVACDAVNDHDAVVVATSRDGGRTFRNEEVAANFDFPLNRQVGRATLTGENFRINSYPQLAIDRLTNQLWVTWADDRNGQYTSTGQSIKTNGDVFVVGSAPGGGNWTAPLQVGSTSDEVYPAVAVFAGRVAVSYYTRTYDPNGIGLDYAYSVGWQTRVGGAPVRRITTQTENPQVQFVAQAPDGTVLQGVFIGDYTAIAMGFDFVIHPCWTDFRGKPGTTQPNQDVYSQGIFAL